jgi:hypothetical protein
MVPGAILNDDDGLAGLGQEVRQKGLITVGIEAFGLAFPE